MVLVLVGEDNSQLEGMFEFTGVGTREEEKGRLMSLGSQMSMKYTMGIASKV